MSKEWETLATEWMGKIDDKVNDIQKNMVRKSDCRACREGFVSKRVLRAYLAGSGGLALIIAGLLYNLAFVANFIAALGGQLSRTVTH